MEKNEILLWIQGVDEMTTAEKFRCLYEKLREVCPVEGASSREAPTVIGLYVSVVTALDQNDSIWRSDLGACLGRLKIREPSGDEALGQLAEELWGHPGDRPVNVDRFERVPRLSSILRGPQRGARDTGLFHRGRATGLGPG